MKRFLCALFVMAWITGSWAEKPADAAGKTVVIAMCEPTVSQIRNIEEMYEKDILPMAELRLIGVYCESEETDFQPARDYVKNNQLDWVSFRPITGKVEKDALFRENAWTPQFREIASAVDGIIFTGGMDIPPALYGQEQSLLAEVTTPQRSSYEISFLFHLVGGSRNPGWVPLLEQRRDFPVLAICLGCQSLNIAAGGTLVQDIPSDIYGQKTVEQVLRQDPQSIHSALYAARTLPGVQKLAPQFHQIRFKKDSIFHGQMDVPAGWMPRVLSSHHQAIDALGKNLSIAATSLDGKVVEAVEHRLYRHVLGIQFHPEPYILYRKGAHFRARPEAEPELNLRAFLDADGVSLAFHRLLWRWFCGAL